MDLTDPDDHDSCDLFGWTIDLVNRLLKSSIEFQC